ncbi:hypothetical protein EC973_005985 [Apophysomyces ossiformis]|uniref:Uncharacterized protein n=1 Tax=Apophysomyces ossiformis TaxID=679940 RepID=A0A8H7BJ73_9FUNG|nr:hypothetical protein EC973_005985 [Apophysomyces ossiformis]
MTDLDIQASNSDLYNKKSWEKISVKGQLNFAGHGHYTDRIDITKPLQIQYNKHVVSHSFEIIDLPQGMDVLLGFDIIPKLGIALVSIATKWDDSKQNSNNSDKIIDILEPNNSPARTAKEHATFITAIQPYINANEAILKTSFCTVSESIVELPTPAGQYAYQYQYPIPFKLKPVIDEVVKIWLMEGTIIRAPVNTA